MHAYFPQFLGKLTEFRCINRVCELLNIDLRHFKVVTLDLRVIEHR